MSYSETAALNAIFGILGTFWLLVVAYFVISIIANWKIFTKATRLGGHRTVLQTVHRV